MSISQEKKKALLNRVFWDKTTDIDYAVELLDGKPERFPGDRTNLYRRLLTTYDWYTILNIIAVEKLKDEALSDNVVGQLFPKELRKKYRYAREVLSE